MKTYISFGFMASLALMGCRFDPSGVPLDARLDASMNEPDAAAPPDAPPPDAFVAVQVSVDDVIHVPTEGEFGMNVDLILSEDAFIDTDALRINNEMPTDIVFDAYTQTGDMNPEIAVLHVQNFTINSGADVRVTGTRPLVIIATESVTVEGIIDVSADGERPGAGGYGPGAGPGAGGDGEHAQTLKDSGGGGAGHATAGAAGGRAVCDGVGCNDATGGVAGMSYTSDPMMPVLQGGSGGGAASPACSPAAGAGGGAVQIYAAGSITIGMGGGINAGGGGGDGGNACDPDNFGSGSGGGSGGVIFLQSPMITHEGTIAANGGGGGGGAGFNGSNMRSGMAGQDGQLSTSAAIGGDPGGNAYGYAGGAGGAMEIAPIAGTEAPYNCNTFNCTIREGNAGGGGGAVGHIVFMTAPDSPAGSGITSPAAAIIPPPANP